MSTRDVMIKALELAQSDLDNYKQVEKEWNMNEEVKPKRPRGNPNFVKKEKSPEGVGVMTPTSTPNTFKYEYVETESDVWLKLYAAVIGTYNATGPATMKAAAQNADVALAEYKARYAK